jgi:hypothetical protein
MRSRMLDPGYRPLHFRTLARVGLLTVLLVLAGDFPARAQSAKLDLGMLQDLSRKADRVTNVTLDHQMLQLALSFMSKDDDDDAEARHVLQQLQGVYVRDFEFDKPGEYSEADVNAILAQLHAAPWRRIVSSRDVKSHETADVFVIGTGNSVQGLAVINAEPKELTVVNIVGALDLDKLSDLEGHFGIPRVKLNAAPSPKPAEAEGSHP